MTDRHLYVMFSIMALVGMMLVPLPFIADGVLVTVLSGVGGGLVGLGIGLIAVMKLMLKG